MARHDRANKRLRHASAILRRSRRLWCFGQWVSQRSRLRRRRLPALGQRLADLPAVIVDVAEREEDSAWRASQRRRVEAHARPRARARRSASDTASRWLLDPGGRSDDRVVERRISTRDRAVRARTIVHVKRIHVRAARKELAFEAIIAGSQGEPIFAGLTGLHAAAKKATEAARSSSYDRPQRDEETKFVLVAEVREDTRICGQAVDAARGARPRPEDDAAPRRDPPSTDVDAAQRDAAQWWPPRAVRPRSRRSRVLGDRGRRARAGRGRADRRQARHALERAATGRRARRVRDDARARPRCRSSA